MRRASDAARIAPVLSAREPLIERTLATDSIDILFQPIFDIRLGQAVGAEVLARLPGIEGGEELFRRARVAGLAERLSRHVQRKALSQVAGWSDELAGLSISLNVLPEDLARPGFDVWLLAEIDRVGVRPERLTVEITEQALIGDTAAVADRLKHLRSAGLKIALDDFGSGYASMAYLSALPLDAIKIDRRMVQNIETNERQGIVTRSVLRLARELGLSTVVEGVESAGQLGLLRDWGCDLYQGFLGSAALGERSLARFVAAAR